MAGYSLPLHVQTDEEDYVVEDNYHDNGMTSPHDLGPWMEDQSDGGGKFRLKRRRRCGQCGPCQVKENCGKCQYCVRKDVLKQACIYRKCVYLRKPVPRFRPDGAGSSSSSSGSGTVGGGGSGTGSSANKASPQKVSSASALSNHHGPTASPFNASTMAAAAAAAQSVELSSCRLAQSPFGLAVNNGVIDPLRSSTLDQHRSAHFEALGVLDPARTSYLASASARGLDPGRSPVLDLARNTNTADSGLGTSTGSLPTSPANSTKDRPVPRDQFRVPMEQWSAMPYGFPRHPWTHPALQSNAAAAAAYGFQPTTSPFSNPFSSSCRLGMPDPTSHLTAAPQATFHNNFNMPFPRPDLASHANFRSAAPTMRPTMTPPFYPPPPQHMPSSLPNFPTFNQLPSSAGPHGTYPMAHPPMYPSNFYTSFRPPTEPQIYHAHISPPQLPFSADRGFGAGFLPFLDKNLDFKKSGKEDDNGMHKKLDFLNIPGFRCSSDNFLYEKLDLLRDFSGEKVASEQSFDETSKKDMNVSKFVKKEPALVVVPEPSIDKDLRQQLKMVSDRKCDVISIDDLKMQAFIRSDGFNNLEIEIDSPLSPVNTVPSSNNHLRQRHQSLQPSFPERESEEVSGAGKDDSSSCHHDCDESDNGVSESSSSVALLCVKADPSTGSSEESIHSFDTALTRIVSDDIDVCMEQDLGEEGIVQVDITGSKIQLEEVVLDEETIGMSSDPDDLVRFLAQHVPPPASPKTVRDLDQAVIPS